MVAYFHYILRDSISLWSLCQVSVRYETASEGQTGGMIAQLNKVHFLEKLLKITSNLSKMLTKAPKHNSNKNHWQGARALDRKTAHLLSLPLTKAGFGFQQAWGALQQYISTAYIARVTITSVVLLATPAAQRTVEHITEYLSCFDFGVAVSNLSDSG